MNSGRVVKGCEKQGNIVKSCLGWVVAAAVFGAFQVRSAETTAGRVAKDVSMTEPRVTATEVAKAGNTELCTQVVRLKDAPAADRNAILSDILHSMAEQRIAERSKTTKLSEFQAAYWLGTETSPKAGAKAALLK